MPGNLVNRHDIRSLVERGPGFAASILRRLLSSSRARTRETWSHTSRPPNAWIDIPAVRERCNTRISGDPQVDFRQHVLRTHLHGREALRGLSLGCGTGTQELRWAQTGRLASLDAWDLSPGRIEYASAQARAAGLQGVLRYHAGDILRMPLVDAAFDLVIAQGALHHFSPLEAVLGRIGRALAPDGLFVLEDFVGPTRFQWGARQLEAVNAVLALLPARLRTLHATPGAALRPKRPVFAPSRARMWLADPSEAVESGRILELLPGYFEILELRPLGGGLLHLLLNGIAHHFVQDDRQARDWLQFCFEAEDLLMHTGDLDSDFVAVVCAKRALARDPGDPARGSA